MVGIDPDDRAAKFEWKVKKRVGYSVNLKCRKARTDGLLKANTQVKSQRGHQIVMEPVNLWSLELAPIVMPVVPVMTCQDCEMMSHFEKSYRERFIVTVSDCPGDSQTLSKPFRVYGGEPAEDGGER
jgi:hypothetical protein